MPEPANRSLLRRSTFLLLLFAFIWIAIEAAAFLTGAFLLQSINPFGIYSSLKDNVEADAAYRTDIQYYNPEPDNLIPRAYVLHPYFGMVRDSLSLPKMLPQDWREQAERFDLFHWHEFIVKKQPGTINILLTGGSVAEHFGYMGQSFFMDELKSDPRFAEQDIVLWRACSGGYKQPQQLIIVNTLLAMGAEFDAVVNLDGFNDVVLPVAENWPSSINPWYPRRWDMLMAGVLNQDVLNQLGERGYLIQQRLDWLGWFDQAPLNWSPALNLIWHRFDRKLSQRIAELTYQIESNELKEVQTSAKGPKAPFEKREEGLSLMARFWRDSSLQMHEVCEMHGVRYFHLLQPNQYVDGSKPFSAEEREKFINNFVFAEPATLAYPMLIAKGQEIEAAGVRYFDLTQLFADVEETIYIDDCCHYNMLGQELLAREIARILSANWNTAP